MQFYLTQARLSRNLAIASSLPHFLSPHLSIRAVFRPAVVKLMSRLVDGGGGSAEGAGESSVMNAGKLGTKSRL
jgi:hypothetical protein